MAASRSFASGGQWRVLTGAALNATPPSPPFISSLSYENNELLVTLAAPISTGGSSVTAYTVQATPSTGGVLQQASDAGPVVAVKNLLGNVAYTIRARATNTTGDGAWSATQVFTPPQATYVKPLAYNTGYPHGLPGDTRTPQTLTPIASADFVTLIQATAGNVTISNYDVQGAFDLRRNNIVFQNCRFNGIPGTTNDAGYPYIAAGGSPQPTTVTFIDCEFAGNGVEQLDPDGDLNLGWGHSLPCNVVNQTHVRSNIWGFLDGMHATYNSRYESCYIHDLTFFYTPTDSSHNDGFQFVGDASDFAVIGCNIDVASEGVNAVMQYNGGNAPNFPRERLTIAYNWFNGGGYYMFSGAPNLANENLSMVMANNRFGLTAGALAIWYPDSGWPNAVSSGKLILGNNVWDTTGTTSYGQAVTAGSPIPEPTL